MALQGLRDGCVRGGQSPPRKGQPSEQVGRARARGGSGQDVRGVRSAE